LNLGTSAGCFVFCMNSGAAFTCLSSSTVVWTFSAACPMLAAAGSGGGCRSSLAFWLDLQSLHRPLAASAACCSDHPLLVHCCCC
jgi:hypothetical protein